MTENDNAEPLVGKKIFFLHASILIQNKIVEELAQEEFEVYSVKDETRLRYLLRRYPDSIVFANISDGMRESAWENWIRTVMMDNATAGVSIGIIAYGEDANLRHKYTELLKIRCGYTVMKPDLPMMVRQLADILDNVSAKGRRKYIRVLTDNETNITVNLPMNGTFINGVVKDISTAGFSCSFTEEPELSRNTHFTDIQLRLQTEFLKVQGMFFGSRMQGTERVFVILITQHTAVEERTRIRKFIRSLLQSRIDNELSSCHR